MKKTMSKKLKIKKPKKQNQLTMLFRNNINTKM